MNEQALKERLHVISKEKGLRFNECWKKLLLERFLSRLAQSPLRTKFIFKGGFLLSYFLKIGRETIDLDFLLSRMKAEEKEIQKAIEMILTEKSNDGFLFIFEKIKMLTQTHMAYPGYRLTLKAFFGKMQDQIQIDLGIGDAVEPQKKAFSLFRYRGKPLFENEISLLVYPPETIFAEKLETVIAKGAANSRMKDFHDLLLLLREKSLMDPERLQTAITKTFQHRETHWSPIKFETGELKFLQRLWANHQKNLSDVAKDLDLPSDISLVIEEINHYLGTVLKDHLRTTNSLKTAIIR